MKNWGYLIEVIKYQTKPSNLIGNGGEKDRDCFLGYTRQMHGSKAIFVDGLFREYFRELEKEPEDFIGSDDEEVDGNAAHLLFEWKRREKKYRVISMETVSMIQLLLAKLLINSLLFCCILTLYGICVLL